MKPTHFKCPHCGGRKAIPIVYGYPTKDTWRLAEAGLVRIGGCCVSDSDPDRACPVCHFHWDSENGKGNIVSPPRE